MNHLVSTGSLPSFLFNQTGRRRLSITVEIIVRRQAVVEHDVPAVFRVATRQKSREQESRKYRKRRRKFPRVSPYGVLFGVRCSQGAPRNQSAECNPVTAQIHECVTAAVSKPDWKSTELSLHLDSPRLSSRAGRARLPLHKSRLGSCRNPRRKF
jgi:hypothetical protein